MKQHQTPDSAYANRDQKLKVLSTLNEALAPASNCATSSKPRCELHVLHSIQVRVPRSYCMHLNSSREWRGL
jgi:hypothetical protein